MKLLARLLSPSGDARPINVSAPVIRLGRDTVCEVAVDPVAYPKVSGLHARIEQTHSEFVLVPLSRTNKTLLNGQPVDDPTPLRQGDVVRLGATGPIVELLSLESATPILDLPVEYGETVQGNAQHLAMLRGSARADRLEIGNGGLIGRDADQAQMLLDHPHVSRLHARLTVRDGQAILADLRSANGTFINGRRLARPAALQPGDRIDIGPFALRFDGAALISTSRANNVELVARGVSRVVKDRGTGKPLPLLQDVSLVVRPREFVCLLGPSGSGKSTLLAILSGRAAPDTGTVAVNGRDLYAHFAALKQDIAVVPQKDLLHDALLLGRALRYTAELRLPPDTQPMEIDASVTDILDVVSLSHRQDTQIRFLSGGQLKRASLANELLCKPSLLFLDEVTSGLDEQTDREMMDLFRVIAEGGKTVVCVTHNLANVETACHLVVILTAGGRLAFVGTPDEAKGYFAVARLGDVYRRLADKTPVEWEGGFRSSPLFTRYILNRLPLAQDGEESRSGGLVDGEQLPASMFRQARVLTRRYASIWRGDPVALLTMFGQSLLVAVLLSTVFGRLADVPNPIERTQRTINLLFLLSVSSFWFGCNNAAKELVKERAIFFRERDFNLRADSYYLSKLLVLALVGLAQVGFLFGVVRLCCVPPGNPTNQIAILFLLVLAGTSLGLLISAFARTEEVAIALVPVAVIPQIIMAGVVAPLSGISKVLAKVSASTHWGQQGLERLLPEGDRVLLGQQTSDWVRPALYILTHTLVFMTATLFLLSTRSRRQVTR